MTGVTTTPGRCTWSTAAITIYDRDVKQHIARKNKTGYRDAVRQLHRIRRLPVRACQPELATATVERVRTQLHQQRNLMALLSDLPAGSR